VTADVPGWSPEVERSFKEVLFRFLEEVNATKAALYLSTERDAYGLASQYGFGRRDLLAAEHRAGDPFLPLVAGLRGKPRAFDRGEELRQLVPYLDGASTSRLLLVPLSFGDRVLGFVDARDKGRGAPFTDSDVKKSARIAEALVGLLRELQIYPGLELPEAAESGPETASATVSLRVGGVALDAEGLQELAEVARSQLADNGAETVAVTLVEASGATCLALTSGRFGNEERTALVRHQARALEEHGLPAPEEAAWSVIPRQLPIEARRPGARSIGSAVLLGGDNWAVVGSVVSPRASVRPQALLGRLRETAAVQRTGTQLRFARRRFVLSLAEELGKSSPELFEHLVAVSRLSWSLAHALGLGPDAAEEAALAGLIHDIGLAELLRQSGYRGIQAGPENGRQVQRHAELGQARLEVCGLDKLARIVRHHHERWDGGGYPDRLAGEAIPRLARIVHVAEVYDVLVGAHSYRTTVSQNRALGILRAAAAHQFDPTVVSALGEVLACET
jgi:HD domain